MNALENITINETPLRALVDLRDRTLQKARIAFGNRISALERGADHGDNSSLKLYQTWNERFSELEKALDEDIKDLVEGVEIVDRMVDVKGVGKILAAKVISMIDIHKTDTVSALWRYAGYAVFDGKRERPVKGEKLHYNIRLKTACYLVASSFLRCNSPYRKIYDDSRVYYEANRPDWTKAHQHNASMRRMIKMWLSHLWVVWRQIEGLPVRNLYVEEYQGHTHITTPEEFGWKPIK